MANIDEHGNKIGQIRINKEIVSRTRREQRTALVVMQSGMNLKYCNMCGYRKRGINHESGSHHQQAPKVIAKRLADLKDNQ